MTIPTRQVITPKDYSNITGKSERNGRNVLRDIRLKLKKQAHQPVVIAEFCEHMGMPQEVVEPFLRF